MVSIVVQCGDVIFTRQGLNINSRHMREQAAVDPPSTSESALHTTVTFGPHRSVLSLDGQTHSALMAAELGWHLIHRVISMERASRSGSNCPR